MKKNGGSERGEYRGKDFCSPLANHRIYPPQRALRAFCILKCMRLRGIKSRG
jgi:hypothetical protein